MMPPDLRNWVPEDHLVHFVIDAVDQLDLRTARVNERGSGAAQYPPSMMLALLIYSYATGTFSSRQIERSTYDQVPVRFLCADTHPDHDTLCTFRIRNEALLKQSFARIIELAAGCGVLKVGSITVAVDGTKILANASKHAAVSYGYAGEKMEQLKLEIAQLVQKAEQADSTPLQDGLSLPGEIHRRSERLKKLAHARAEIEARAALGEKQVEYEEKMKKRQAKEAATGKKTPGKVPRPPEGNPEGKAQYNFTEPDSRIMLTRRGFEQTYNAQAAVEIKSRLIVAPALTNAPVDKEQLTKTVSAIEPAAGPVGKVLIDSGYFSEKEIRQVEGTAPGSQPTGVQVLAAVKRDGHGRTIAQLEKRDDPAAPKEDAPFTEHMAHRVATQEGRLLYKQRQQTVEPVFGIIKEAMGFRRFSLRGLVKVALEWTLVTLAYNVKRLFHLKARFAC
jgi:transposase